MRGIDRFLPNRTTQTDTPESGDESEGQKTQQKAEGEGDVPKSPDLEAQLTELREQQATLTRNLGQLTELMTQDATQRRQQAQQQQQAPPQPPLKPVTEDDIAAALQGIVNEDGELDPKGLKAVAAKFGEAMKYQVEALVREHIDPLRTLGVSQLEAHTREILALKGSMPYYGPKGDPEITKQVDEMLGQLDPGIRSNAEVIERVYASVVGNPANLNRIIGAEVEKQMRQNAETITPPKPGARTPTKATTGKEEGEETELPTAEQLGGALGMNALAMLGRGGKSPDEFAKGMGFESWDAYMEMAREYGLV